MRMSSTPIRLHGSDHGRVPREIEGFPNISVQDKEGHAPLDRIFDELPQDEDGFMCLMVPLKR